MADSSKTLDILIRVRADIQAALAQLGLGKKGVDDLGTSSQKADGFFSKLTDTFEDLAAPVAAFFTARGLLEFFESSIEEAGKAEAATANLRSEITLSGASYEAVSPAINNLAEDVRRYGVSNTQVSQSIAGLLARNFSLQQSFDAVRRAAQLVLVEGGSFEEKLNDIVNATNGVLRPSSLLGQLLVNQREQLLDAATAGERFNIVFSNLGQLDEIATARLGDAQLKVQSLGTAFKDFEEQVGKTGFAKSVIDDIGFLADKLKSFNDEVERSKNVAAGTLPNSQKFADAAKQTETELETVLKLQDRLNGTTPAGFNDKFDNTEITNLASILNVGEDEVVANLDKASDNIKQRIAFVIQGLNTLLVQQRTASGQLAKADAGKTKSAITNQQDNQFDAAFDRESADTDTFLQKQAAKELASRADLAAVIDAQDAAIREKRFQAELLGLGDNLQARLALTQQFYAQELKASQDSTAAQIAARQKVINVSATALATPDFGGAEVDRIKEVAQAAADGKGDVTDFVDELAIPENKRAEFLQRFQEIVAQYAKVHEAATKLTGLEIDIPVKVKTATDAELKQAVTDIEDRLNKQLQDIEAQKNTGSVSAQGALTLTIQAKAAASSALQPILASEQTQLTQLDAVVGPLTPEQAAARQQLLKDIDALNSKIAQLKPTLDEEIQQSNDFFEGVSLGAKKAANDAQSFGQIGATAIDTFEHGLATTGTTLFDNLTQGAHNFGAAAKKAFADLAQETADAIVQALLLKAIQSTIGGFFSGGGVAGGGSTGASSLASGRGSVPSGFNGPGFASGGVAAHGIITAGTTSRADDVIIAVSKGEGIVHAAAVQHYGPSIIHALNRFAIPRQVFQRERISRGLRFANGGVVGQIASENPQMISSNGRNQVLKVVVPIGPDEIAKIGRQSAFKDASLAAIESNPTRAANAIQPRLKR